jgi:lysophospholipase L1-like esterase
LCGADVVQRDIGSTDQHVGTLATMCPSPESARTGSSATGRTRRATGVAGVAVVVLAALGSGCSGSSPDVAVVGDSITVLLQDRLSSGSDGEAWNVAATNGATAADMQPAAAQLASAPHDQAVIDLGTNDALRQVPTAETLGVLGAMLDAFGDADCIHLVTVTTRLPPSGEPPAPQSAQLINDWIRATADERDEVHVIDWDQETAAAGGEQLLESDLIHPNAQGQEQLEAMIRDAVSDC